MIYIGLISKNKNIELAKELNDINVQAINIKTIDDSKNIKLDILVIEDLVLDKEFINKIIQNVKYLIIQDNINDLELHLDKEINIITFGFNHKSTVTVSSVTDDNIIICIQRTIKSINNKAIGPKESVIKNTNKYNINKYIIKKIIQEILEKQTKN